MEQLAILVQDGCQIALHVIAIMYTFHVILVTIMRLLLALIVVLLARLVHQIPCVKHVTLTTSLVELHATLV